MGFLDDVKGKLGEFGDKAGEAFEAAKDKAADLVDDIKDRVSGADDSAAADVAPETADTPAAPEPFDAGEPVGAEHTAAVDEAGGLADTSAAGAAGGGVTTGLGEGAPLQEASETTAFAETSAVGESAVDVADDAPLSESLSAEDYPGVTEAAGLGDTGSVDPTTPLGESASALADAPFGDVPPENDLPASGHDEPEAGTL